MKLVYAGILTSKGRSGVYLYLLVLPDEFLLKSVVTIGLI